MDEEYGRFSWQVLHAVEASGDELTIGQGEADGYCAEVDLVETGAIGDYTEPAEGELHLFPVPGGNSA